MFATLQRGKSTVPSAYGVYLIQYLLITVSNGHLLLQT